MPSLTASVPATAKGYPRINYDRYVVIPVWYYCNSACTFCMVERQIAELPTVDLETFKGIVQGIIEVGKHDCLILSGAEVTTFPQLHEYVAYAKSTGYFQRIQIQTNARRLSDRALTEKLLEAGLNEFFISFHGLEEAHDKISEVPGGWQETMRGIEILSEFPHVNLITNTVLTKTNFPQLVELITFISQLPVSEMHMWNFFPMAGVDKHDLLVDLKPFFAKLPEILAVMEQAGKPIVFKGFPECLSLGKPGFFDSRFPLNLIDKAFWDNFDENQFGHCEYKHVCSAKECFGLSSAYVKKFGDERDLLCPRA